MGAFLDALPVFAAQGVPVIPTRPDQPSMPMVRQPAKFGVSACRKLAENPRFSDANAGLWTGPRSGSGLAILDIDSSDPSHAADIIHLCGDTPLKVRTPSGGLHLYYRHNGETRRIRPFGNSLPFDILGNGLAVGPPSWRPASGKKPAGAYRVIEGDLAALDALPCIRAGALPRQAEPAVRSPHGSTIDVRGMREGDGRDAALFKIARHAAVGFETEGELVAAVLSENAKMAEPLSASKAKQKAAQAWKYKMDGKLIVAGDRAAVMDLGTIKLCQGHPVAFQLLAYLRSHHSVSHQFAIVPGAVAPVIGQSPNTVRKERDWLVGVGQLTLIRQGGGGGAAGGGIPSLYRLGERKEGTLQNLEGIELNTLSPLLRPISTGRGSND